MNTKTQRSHLAAHQSVGVTRPTALRPCDEHVASVHPHATIILIEQGRARIRCGATFDLRPHDLLVIPEGHPHHTEASDDARAWALSLCTSCLSSPAGKHLASLCQGPPHGAAKLRVLDPPAAQRLSILLSQLEQELRGQAAWRDVAVEGYLGLIAALAHRAAPGVVSGEATHGAASISGRALAFITERAALGISLDDVAAAVHRSPAHTATVVKQETGRTVVEWITQARMATARQLLLKTDEAVDAIAARVGFASASHFHRVFKRHHEMGPGHWRRLHAAGVAPRPR